MTDQTQAAAPVPAALMQHVARGHLLAQARYAAGALGGAAATKDGRARGEIRALLPQPGLALRGPPCRRDS
jgi:hypothetical protein